MSKPRSPIKHLLFMQLFGGSDNIIKTDISLNGKSISIEVKDPDKNLAHKAYFLGAEQVTMPLCKKFCTITFQSVKELMEVLDIPYDREFHIRYNKIIEDSKNENRSS